MVHQIHGNNLENVKFLSSMKNKRYNFKAVCLKGEVYVFSGRINLKNFLMSVEKYSPSSNNWSEVAFMFDKRSNFCACAFMDKIYIIGGFSFNGRHKTTNSCLRFNTVEKNWNEVCGMIEVRKKAACEVF